MYNSDLQLNGAYESSIKAYAVLHFAIGLSVKFLSRENYIYI